MGVRTVSLSIVAGICVAFAGTANAQDVQLASIEQWKPESAGCLRPANWAPPSVVSACDQAIDRLSGIDRARAFYNRGRAREDLDDFAGSKADLQRAAEQYTVLINTADEQPSLYYGRALTWHMLGEADKAIADYNVAARLMPNNPLVFLNRGITIARYKSDYKLALVDFDQALSLKPKDREILHRAGEERAAALAITDFASTTKVASR